MSAVRFHDPGFDKRYSVFLAMLDGGEDMAGTNYPLGEETDVTEIQGLTPELAHALTRKATADARIAEAKATEAKLQLDNIKASNDANRVLIIDGPIVDMDGGVSVDECRAILMRWARRDPGKPITIYLNTPGGSIFDGNALIHTLQQLRRAGHHVTIFGQGIVMSLGAVLMQVADERVLDKDTVFMIHSLSSTVVGSFEGIQDTTDMLKGVQERQIERLAERSNMSKTQIKNKTKRKDWFMSADDALKHGFCDRVE